MQRLYTNALASRADLFLLDEWASSDEQRYFFGRLLGYAVVESRKTAVATTIENKISRVPLPENKSSFSIAHDDESRPRPEEKATRLTFLRMISKIPNEEKKALTAPPDWFLNADKITTAELMSARKHGTTDMPFLIPWTRLWPFLQSTLSKTTATGRIDVGALTEKIASCNFFFRIPRKIRSEWFPEIHLLIDKANDLLPFFDDMNAVKRGIQRLCKRSSLKIFEFHRGIEDRRCVDEWGNPVRYVLPGSGSIILAVGDGGMLSGSIQKIDGWVAFGKKISRKRIPHTLLTPCPPNRWNSDMARYWEIHYWDLHRRPDAKIRKIHIPTGFGEDAIKTSVLKQQALSLLLRLLSPVIHLEHEMIRRLRTALPVELTDTGVEYDVWQERHCLQLYRETDIDGKIIGDDQLTKLQCLVVEMIAGYHADQKERAFLELIIMKSIAPQTIEYIDNVLEKLQLTDFDARLAKTAAESDAHTVNPIAVKKLVEKMEERVPPTVWAKPQMAALWAIVHKNDDVTLPGTIQPSSIAWIYSDTVKNKTTWNLCQSGEDILVIPDDEPSAFPIGSFTTIENVCFVARHGTSVESNGEIWHFSPGMTIENVTGMQADCSRVTITSLPETVEFETLTLPPWAEEIGRDEYGLYVFIEVKGVRQRMRWINPGKFMMGSPEGEEGRFENEKQHEVVLTNGYWLFDTPVTQAFWAVIMGKNPSRFQSPDRPVEQVSWDDCQEFIKRVNQRVPELVLRFPTEAEWEYACRAGVETATYAGEMKIIGDNNAPVLDKIAWYGGNSGVDFELNNGYDSSDWSAKQYDHKKAGSHPVAKRLPNRWGLYDMHGNVWEWCKDWYIDYPAGLVENPCGPEEGESRVLRGGSWIRGAWRCRSAYRGFERPDSRNCIIGFRPSRGHELKRAEQGGAGSQSQRLDVPEIIIYKWHMEVGEDEYGHWLEFAYKNAIQRMRRIKPGKFLMGSPEDEPERNDDEIRHEVTITHGYWLADTACTQELWEIVMGDNPSKLKGQQQPVDNVSWDDCQLFLQRINVLTKLLDICFCLPTEAQWEYACRAGTLSPFSFGENISPEQVNYHGGYPYNHGKKGLYRGQFVRVKSLPPNNWGLFEMHGNVWEWCNDWYGVYSYEMEIDPTGPKKGGFHVVRGGSCYYWASFCRSAYRYSFDPSYHLSSIGVRLSGNSKIIISGTAENTRAGQPEGVADSQTLVNKAFSKVFGKKRKK